MMIERVDGIFLDINDARYLADVLDTMCQAMRPSARLTDLRRRVRKAVPNHAAPHGMPLGGVLSGDAPDDDAPYDLVGPAEAAALLGTTVANVADLRRRGSLPAHRAGHQYLFPRRAVLVRAERKRQRRGR